MEPRRSLGVPRPSTHAGGIQPSSSFFRPSKPSHSLSPISVSPLESSSVIDIQQEDVNNQHINTSNNNGEEPGSGTREDSLDLNSSNATPSSPTSPTSGPVPHKKARSSLDAIFNLRRGNSASKAVVEQHAMKQQHQRHQPRKSFGTGTFTEDEMDEEQSIGYPPRKYIPPSPSISPSHSRSHSRLATSNFNPNRPPAHPPLSAVPIIDPKAPTKALRNYRLHPSRNQFFFDGLVLTGGDTPWAFIACFGIVLGIAGVFFGTTCVWWWRDYGGAGGKAISIIGAYTSLIVISNMLTTVCFHSRSRSHSSLC
jgi:palmitoyltransferase ZDHHC9/14/18